MNAHSGWWQAMAGGSGSRSFATALHRLRRPGVIKGGIIALNVGLVVLAADFTAQTMWTWAQPSAGRAAIAAYSPDAAKSPASDYRLLTTFDPFHRAAAVPRPQGQLEAERETTLDLKLFGVRAGLDSGRDDGLGSAIIRTPDKHQGAFRVDDTVMDGVTLKRILRDRVVISHRGVLENLFLDEESRTLTIAARSRETVTEEPQDDDPELSDSERLMAAIKAEPRMTGQGIDGFVLTPGTDRALFGKLGLAPGDVLVAVNGSRLNSPDRMQRLRSDLQAAQSIQLEIERDGEKKIIELSNE